MLKLHWRNLAIAKSPLGGVGGALSVAVVGRRAKVSIIYSSVDTPTRF